MRKLARIIESFTNEIVNNGLVLPDPDDYEGGSPLENIFLSLADYENAKDKEKDLINITYRSLVRLSRMKIDSKINDQRKV